MSAAFSNSDIFITSKIVHKWHDLLYVHCGRSVTSWGCPYKLNHKLNTTLNIFASLIQSLLTFNTYISCIITYFYVHRPRACYWINDWFIILTCLPFWIWHRNIITVHPMGCEAQLAWKFLFTPSFGGRFWPVK